MRPFNDLLFCLYASDLAEAVYDLSREMKFKITENTFFLGQDRKPGDILDNPTGPYKYQLGTGKRTAQFVELPSEVKTVAVTPPIPTPLPSVSPIAPAPIVAKPIEKPSMSITGLASGLIEAKMADMQKRLADRIGKSLTKIDTAVDSGATKLDIAVDGVVAKVEKDIDDKLQEFSQYTNGGPA